MGGNSSWPPMVGAWVVLESCLPIYRNRMMPVDQVGMEDAHEFVVGYVQLVLGSDAGDKYAGSDMT